MLRRCVTHDDGYARFWKRRRQRGRQRTDVWQQIGGDLGTVDQDWYARTIAAMDP